MILHFPRNGKHQPLLTTIALQYYLMAVQHIAVILIPVLFYMLWNKYYLNKSEMELLVTAMLMLVALAFDSWVTYLAYFVLLGWHTIVLFNMSRFTYYFDRYKSIHNFSKSIEFLFKVEEEEVVLILYAVVIWIWVRVVSLKSHDYDFGGNFLTVLKGWNCTLSEFWWIYFLWAFFTLLSCYSCHFLIKNETDRNNLYKIYLLKYKLAIDQIVLIIVFLYNLIVYLQVNDLKLCKDYYDNGAIFRIIWFWGTPISTIIFFLKKHGEFSIESQSEKAEKENDLQEELNHQQIDRQHSKISNQNEKRVSLLPQR